MELSTLSYQCVHEKALRNTFTSLQPVLVVNALSVEFTENKHSEAKVTFPFFFMDEVIVFFCTLIISNEVCRRRVVNGDCYVLLVLS